MKNIMINTRQKGMQLTKYVSKEIREKGLDPKAFPRGDSGAGNIEKTDITTSMTVNGVSVGIECKFADKYKMSEWWQQTRKLENLGLDPTLIFKLNNERFESTKVVIYLETYLELIKASYGINDTTQVDTPKTRKALHFLENAKSSIKSALNILE